MRIYYAFLVILTAAVLFMLPITDAVYNFRTDVREDTFISATAAGDTTANVTLFKPVYLNDTSTIDLLSSLSSDTPTYSSYNITTRLLGVSGLTSNVSRTLTVDYDVDALNASSALNTILDKIPWIWILMILSFPIAALIAIFTGRA